jgi:hypothetical protein
MSDIIETIISEKLFNNELAKLEPAGCKQVIVKFDDLYWQVDKHHEWDADIKYVFDDGGGWNDGFDDGAVAILDDGFEDCGS